MTLRVETGEIRFSIPDTFVDRTRYVFTRDSAELTLHNRYLPAKKSLTTLIDRRRDAIVEDVQALLPHGTVQHVTGDVELAGAPARFLVVAVDAGATRSRHTLVIARFAEEDGLELSWHRALLANESADADPAELLAIVASACRPPTARMPLLPDRMWRAAGRLSLALPAGLDDPRDFVFEHTDANMALGVSLCEEPRPLQESPLWRERFAADVPWHVHETSHGPAMTAHAADDRVFSVDCPDDATVGAQLVREVRMHLAEGNEVSVIGVAPATKASELDSLLGVVLRDLAPLE
jgi:hypothetical protein